MIPALGVNLPRVVLLRIPAKLVLTMLAPVLSHHYFETPFLKLKKRYAIAESRPV